MCSRLTLELTVSVTSSDSRDVNWNAFWNLINLAFENVFSTNARTDSECHIERQSRCKLKCFLEPAKFSFWKSILDSYAGKLIC